MILIDLYDFFLLYTVYTLKKFKNIFINLGVNFIIPAVDALIVRGCEHGGSSRTV